MHSKVHRMHSVRSIDKEKFNSALKGAAHANPTSNTIQIAIHSSVRRADGQGAIEKINVAHVRLKSDAHLNVILVIRTIGMRMCIRSGHSPLLHRIRIAADPRKLISRTSTRAWFDLYPFHLVNWRIPFASISHF